MKMFYRSIRSAAVRAQYLECKHPTYPGPEYLLFHYSALSHYLRSTMLNYAIVDFAFVVVLDFHK